eukprot:TRINITY_DN9332_c0_g1_i1.p2 TRINITY_DN9332_c0_g1~~TRINITY_DN9332_c0_g1_i1.p2  ORF type:complete len:295 (-),score=44.33 TRINITY_DN9332_c0_g1_i1:74-958(-)
MRKCATAVQTTTKTTKCQDLGVEQRMEQGAVGTANMTTTATVFLVELVAWAPSMTAEVVAIAWVALHRATKETLVGAVGTVYKVDVAFHSQEWMALAVCFTAELSTMQTAVSVAMVVFKAVKASERMVVGVLCAAGGVLPVTRMTPAAVLLPVHGPIDVKMQLAFGVGPLADVAFETIHLAAVAVQVIVVILLEVKVYELVAAVLALVAVIPVALFLVTMIAVGVMRAAAAAVAAVPILKVTFQTRLQEALGSGYTIAVTVKVLWWVRVALPLIVYKAAAMKLQVPVTIDMTIH